MRTFPSAPGCSRLSGRPRPPTDGAPRRRMRPRSRADGSSCRAGSRGRPTYPTCGGAHTPAAALPAPMHTWRARRIEVSGICALYIERRLGACAADTGAYARDPAPQRQLRSCTPRSHTGVALCRHYLPQLHWHRVCRAQMLPGGKRERGVSSLFKPPRIRRGACHMSAI